MIILREKQFGPDDRRGGNKDKGGQQPRQEGKFLTHEELKDTKAESFNRGKEAGRAEAKAEFKKELEEKAREKSKKSKRWGQFKEYTGLDSIEAWGKKKKSQAKEWVKGHKKVTRAASLGTLGLTAAGGLTYGGIKVYKSAKRKKSNEDLRKKVRGYDSVKKKK